MRSRTSTASSSTPIRASALAIRSITAGPIFARVARISSTVPAASDVAQAELELEVERADGSPGRSVTAATGSPTT